MADTTTRVLEAIHQQHRIDRGRLAMQAFVYRRQLQEAGIQPDDMGDEELERLWKAAANTVSAASLLVAELGTGKELIDPNLCARSAREMVQS